MLAKSRAFNYYLGKCEQLGLESDVFDFEAEVDGSLTYGEMLTIIDKKAFSCVNDKSITTQKAKDMKAQFKNDLIIEKHERELESVQIKKDAVICTLQEKLSIEDYELVIDLLGLEQRENDLIDEIDWLKEEE